LRPFYFCLPFQALKLALVTIYIVSKFKKIKLNGFVVI
jgi:hypothetical protein